MAVMPTSEKVEIKLQIFEFFNKNFVGAIGTCIRN